MSEKYYRKTTKAPGSLVSNGQFNFGCFNSEIKNVNFYDAKPIWNKNTPKWFRNFRLKEWQAFQFWHKEFFIFGAVYNAKTIGISIFSIYNFKTKDKFHQIKQTFPFKQNIANGLNNTESFFLSKNLRIDIQNHIELKKFKIEVLNKSDNINFELTAYHTTEPTVVIIPLGKNRATYSHKAIMPCVGNLKMGTKELAFGRNDSLLILDDHKGFYPYEMHYNWCTGTWRGPEGSFYGFNLTKNQSIDEENFNENCIWVNGILNTLPPVIFRLTNNKKWLISDKYGMVNLEFTLKAENNYNSNLGIIKANYQAPYGVFNGIIKTSKQTFRLNNVIGMGEFKRLKM